MSKRKATKAQTRRVLSGGRRGGKTTELARRAKHVTRKWSTENISQALMRVKVNDPNNLLLPDTPAAVGVLTEDPALGHQGTVELKLTKAEELELSQPVQKADVLIKPTGQPYLPHRVYTLWFNRAFGRFGWALVPRAKPVKAAMVDKEDQGEKRRHLILVPYQLHVHGHPVAFAWGEQEYNETNAEQTYGDAVESTVANALRRCAKRIGVGLELWDKDWLQAWRDEHAVQVTIKGYGQAKNFKRWRRKKDKPLPFEISTTSDIGERAADATADWNTEELKPPPGDESRRRERPAAGNDGTGDTKITKPQRQRLATIARKAGRHDADVRLWLKGKWQVNTSADILRKDYDQVCRELEASGPLQIPGDGEGK